MLHLKSYVGSIVLAALLLQGCGSDTETTEVTPGVSAAVQQFNTATEALSSGELSAADQAQVLSDLTLKIASLDATDSEVYAYISGVIADNSEVTNRADAYAALAIVMTNNETADLPSSLAGGFLSGITDKLKDGLVKVLDTSVGNKITSAAFDVVLNSTNVTVVMIDLARKSETTAQIMVDSMDADWSLAEKMCPMLRSDTEFGEKFTALAYERPTVGKFFFERIDATMYGCLTDAMLLSNDDAKKGEYSDPVKYSTNGYMGVLMNMYAEEYFVSFGSGANKTTQKATVAEDGHKKGESVKYAKNDTSGNLATDDNFVNLLADTQAVVTYDGNSTFTGHGDGNELINEKFFYSLFKTPGTTDSFVAAMEKLPQTTRNELMDSIFLGQSSMSDANDTMQGYLNIIAIGSAMYDGIYGVKDAETGTRTGAYGFGAYTGAFIGFAGLIDSKDYMTYGRAFMNAGYQYAAMHGIDVWKGATDAAQQAWNDYTAPTDNPTVDANTTASTAPARSAGLGLTGSDWYDDVLDVMLNAWSNVSLTDVFTAFMDGNQSVLAELQDQGNTAYATFLDGRNADGSKNEAYATDITNPLTVTNDTVYGFHGLIELAMQEDIFYVNCGTRATDYYIGSYTCDNNASYTMDNAKAAFTLPAFADLTFAFAYNTAYDGAMGYYNNNVDANWVADLSTNTLIRDYFYPSADNVYIPSWLLAVDWLSAPANFSNTNVATTDFDFNAGYFDIYVTSTNAALFTVTDENNITTGGDIDLTVIAGLLKEIEVTKVDMGNDDIIAVDANGQTIDGLNVYKIRAITPEDTQAMMNALTALSDDALTAIGLDSSNAGNVDTNTTTAQ